VPDHSSPRFLRSIDACKPRGPLGKATYYRYVEAGYIRLRHVGRMSFIDGIGCVDELIDHLSRVVPAMDNCGRRREIRLEEQPAAE